MSPNAVTGCAVPAASAPSVELKIAPTWRSSRGWMIDFCHSSSVSRRGAGVNCLRAEPLVQHPLFVGRGAEEHERLRDAPRLVELVLGAVQARERLVELDAIRRVAEQELQLGDRLVAARLAGLEVEIRELLVARDVVGRELARDLVRLGRRLGVAEVIEADVAEPRPQLEQLARPARRRRSA